MRHFAFYLFVGGDEYFEQRGLESDCCVCKLSCLEAGVWKVQPQVLPRARSFTQLREGVWVDRKIPGTQLAQVEVCWRVLPCALLSPEWSSEHKADAGIIYGD